MDMGSKTVFVLLLVLPYAISTHPVYGTKRYEKTSTPRQLSTGWSAIHVPSYQPRVAQARYPVNYYDAVYPYTQDYEDYMYAPSALAYPIYYPSRSSGKYDIYLPYYYADRRMVRPDMGYYGFEEDPMDDVQEEVLQQQREERQEALPVGQEMWYENDGSQNGQENVDDVNAAFFHNLIMSQMYNDKHADPYYDDMYSELYGDRQGYYADPITDDQDVKELKQLAKKPEKTQKSKQKSGNKKEQKNKEGKKERLDIFEKNGSKNKKVSQTLGPNDSESWIKWNSKRAQFAPVVTDQINDKGHFVSTITKPQPLVSSATTMQPAISSVPSSSSSSHNKGQKEVVMIRPASPVKHPFASSITGMMAKPDQEEDRKRTPNVYDTIKHLLELEKSMEKDQTENYARPQMRKRFVLSEGGLVQQLNNLKKN